MSFINLILKIFEVIKVIYFMRLNSKYFIKIKDYFVFSAKIFSISSKSPKILAIIIPSLSMINCSG